MLNRFRWWLIKLSSFLGDLNALQRGKLPQRIIRRTVTKHALRALNKVFK